MAKGKGNTSILDKIRRRAKNIRKGTNMTYQTALKKAGAEYRSKPHRSAKAKTTAKKKSSKKRVGKAFTPSPVTASRRLVERTFPGGSVTQHVNAAKGLIADRLAKLEVKKSNAATKRERKAIQKEIAVERKKLRNPFSS